MPTKTRDAQKPASKPRKTAAASAPAAVETATPARPRDSVELTSVAKAPPVPLNLTPGHAYAGQGRQKPTPDEEKQVRQLWVQYRAEPTEALRNQLMQRYLPLVKYNAERVHTKLPDEVDVEDLMQAGMFGLMDAIDAFDLERGVKFETYCAPRIRGAILDELRSMDWVPRLVRSRTSQVEGARRKFEMANGRKPTDDELADKLGVSPDDFAKIRKDSSAVGTVSLSRKWFETDSNKDVREIDVLEDGRQVNPFQAVQKRDLKDLFTKNLSRAERLIVMLYYYEEMTMKEIGVALDLSESRVSQMHSSILARLKAQLSHREPELDEEVD